MDLVVEVYTATDGFPARELYGLTQQLRRAAVSIPSNIAEGHGRRTDRDFARYLSIAHGSACETETQLAIAERLGYLDMSSTKRLVGSCAEIGRMLNGLRNSVDARPPRQ